MSYAPAFPLASYAPKPTSIESVTEADCLAQMPTLDAALLQLDLGHLLGSLEYNHLGRYADKQTLKRGSKSTSILVRAPSFYFVLSPSARG